MLRREACLIYIYIYILLLLLLSLLFVCMTDSIIHFPVFQLLIFLKINKFFFSRATHIKKQILHSLDTSVDCGIHEELLVVDFINI